MAFQKETKPVLILVGGMSGSGKTTLAGTLAQSIPNALHLDSDRTRKAMFGVPETTALPAAAYSSEASAKLVEEMIARARQGLAEGKTVIVSATFLSPDARARQEELAKECGVTCIGLWLQADLNTLFDRVAKRTNDASDANADIVKLQQKGREAHKDEKIGWPVIDATQTREDVAAAALRIIGKAQKPSRGKGHGHSR